jgi:tetratricopeptide (TPR) repeat protein
MEAVRLPARLVAWRQAEQLLRAGRRMVADHDTAGAEPVLQRALASARQSGFDHLVAGVAEDLYEVLLRRRRHDESVPVLHELLARHGRLGGAAGETAAAWRNELIRLLGRLGRHAEAEPLCRDRLGLARERRPRAPQAVGFALVTLAWCLRGQGRWDDAGGLCHEALAVLEDGAPRGSDGWALAGHAAVLLRRLELDRAEAALSRAVASWGSVGRVELAHAAEEQLLDVYVVGERYADALALSTTTVERGRRGLAVIADRERQLRNLERHAFLLRVSGRAGDADRFDLRADYLRQAIESQPRKGDGASPDPSGPVFEGEPTLDWSLPGVPVAARAC